MASVAGLVLAATALGSGPRGTTSALARSIHQFCEVDCQSNPWDPTLYQQILDPVTGDPIEGAAIQVLAVPTDVSYWDPGATFPVVATGTTGGDGTGTDPDAGYVEVADNTTGRAISDWDQSVVYSVETTPTFTDATGSATLQVDYSTDGGNTWIEAFTTPYSFAGAAVGSYDPVLSGQKLLDSDGNPLVNTAVTLYATPLDSSSNDDPIQIGTGTSDSWGYVIANLDPDSINSLLGDSDFVTDNGVINISAQYDDGTGTMVEGMNTPYFVGTNGAPDPMLSQIQMLDSDGNPLPDGTSVRIEATPADPEWPTTLSAPTVGSGVVANGTIQVSLDMSSVQGSPQFEGADPSVNLDVYTVDSDGNSYYAFSIPEYFGTDPGLAAVNQEAAQSLQAGDATVTSAYQMQLTDQEMLETDNTAGAAVTASPDDPSYSSWPDGCGADDGKHGFPCAPASYADTAINIDDRCTAFPVEGAAVDLTQITRPDVWTPFGRPTDKDVPIGELHTWGWTANV